jgi:hypothetical protein
MRRDPSLRRKNGSAQDDAVARKALSGPTPWDSETRLLLWLATCVSVFAFLFYFKAGEILLYGDAIAHINIARRVVDSKTPGLLQLGTVWLPLPHLLVIPFVVSKNLWQSGLGGSIPSMAGYVLGTVGIFRLTRGALSSEGNVTPIARFVAWISALVFAANPNLIYMQTTAMGESLYLAFFIWTLVFFSEALRGDAKAFPKSGLCLLAACLTRYDGWFLAAILFCVVAVLLPIYRIPRAAALKFLFLAAAGPILWLAYNGIVYRNPLEFENGPYSAKAIERRTQSAGNPGHPGSGNLYVAGLYFLKSAEGTMSMNEWLQRGWILLLAAAVAAMYVQGRSDPGTSLFPQLSSWLPLLLLLLPIPFYALSIAYGGVPIFIPWWWPFTHYNVRYGLQLLPAFSAVLAVALNFALQPRWKDNARLVSMLALFAFLTASYVTVWRATPIVLKEAQVNMRTRNLLESQVASLLQKLPPEATLLMYLGDHVGALQKAGIPLRQVINEGNHRVWKQPTDPEGLWERALADPSRYADYVIAFEGDPVWQSAKEHHLDALIELHVTGQAPAALYRAR